MRLVKDLFKARNYEWMGEMKALRVINEFGECVAHHEILREYKDAIVGKFYKAGVLFIATEHPALAHVAQRHAADLLAALNERLRGSIIVKELFFVT